MPDQDREAMSDIISAKCFGCGHVVKVPSALGGKKARCPKCTNTIVIPALSETSDEIVTDDQLPEVARDDEVLEGELIEPDEESGNSAPRPESMREREREPRSSGSHRRPGAKESGVGRVSAARMQGVRAPAPARKSGNTGVVVGVIVAVLVVGGIVAAVAFKPTKAEPPRKTGKGDRPNGTTPDQERTPADDALEARCREFVSAFNRRAVADVARFYDKEPSGDLRRAVGQTFTAEYKAPEFKKSSAAEGVTVFVCEYVVEGQPSQGKEITLRWKQVDGEWFLADRP
jgi:hypothetical protein